jgi:ATP-dependent helicase/nuclease subunit A
LDADDWEKCAGAIRNYNKPTTYKPKDVRGEVAGLVQLTAKRAVEDFKGLSELAVVNPEYLDRVGRAAGLQTKVLVELVKKLDRLYGDAKSGINCLDFADLEHHALRLLTTEDSSDNPSPSETALALRQRYKYIFVDEYQDINPVQQVILDMLSCEGNVFVVGDVKQSIYAWRGAKPEIFIERLEPASVEPVNVQNGLRVDLNTNFRSAEGILDFVNKVFSRIMTPSFTMIDYDESAKLKPALKDKSKAKTSGDSKQVVEFHILDETGTDEDSKGEQTDEEESLNIISSRQRQAALISRRIRQMVGADTGKPEFQIYDKQQDCLRDVEYRDIVILMRSLAKKANDYVEVLRLAGVPVSCGATAGYFEATEISDVVALLKVLDNPQRDIELAAVLRSPFFKISDTELAKIKIHDKEDKNNRNFYSCVVEYSRSGPDAKLVEKLRETLTVIEHWRTVARRGNLADLIWQIYRQTGFLSFVSALPNGQARRANLLKLHDRAIQFEGFASSAGNLSLTRFVEFIEKLQEVGQDWAPAEPDASAGNAVRILSVHKSKGLEFPVVFLAELDSQFNKRDIYSDFLADAKYTLGLQIVDGESNSKLSSLAHQVIAEQKLSMALAEEMRILYVATTRARERLILSACEKEQHCREIICNGFLWGDERISDWHLRRCRSPLDWILYGLSDLNNVHDAFETGMAPKDDSDLFGLALYSGKELDNLSGYILQLKKNKSVRLKPSGKKSSSKRAGGRIISQVKKSLAWQYGFGEAPVLPAKQSVTGLTHRNDEYIKIDSSRALERQPIAVVAAETDLSDSVEGRLIGTATHLVISQIDLSRPINKEAVKGVKERLLADGAFPDYVAEHINTGSIVQFFESELGKNIFRADSVVWREWPFTFAMPASGLPDSSDERRATSGETIIVQGIIDMLIQTSQGLLVIDFKTDRITADEVSKCAEFYRKQLELYGRAAGAILNNKILAKWLYFLSPSCAVKIE